MNGGPPARPDRGPAGLLHRNRPPCRAAGGKRGGVAKGDTLSKISAKYYGDPMLYKKIFEANRDIIKNPDLIQVGWKIRIP